MIVVTTPTGAIGRHVARLLLDAGEPVRLVARDPAKLPPELRDRAEVVAGSHGDPDVIGPALHGARALFWNAPPTPLRTLDDTYRGFAGPAAAAIRREGTAQVVAVTTLGRDTRWSGRAGIATASLAMVDLLRETGAAVRALALPGFMDNLLAQLPAIRSGTLTGPLDPDRAVPLAATPDMAAAAVRWLRDPAWTGWADAPLLGPQDLSFAEVAATLSDLLGRTIFYRQIPFEAVEAAMVERGTSPAYAAGFVAMMRAKNEGMDNTLARTPDNTGPTTFDRWAAAELLPRLAA